MVQTGAKTNTRKSSILAWFGRQLLIICTAGLWLLVGKRKSMSKTRFSNKKMAICQSCGHSWRV